MFSPLARPLMHGLVQPLISDQPRPIGAAAFSPASLFASGESGAWYDPSDLTTVFQDTAGTTPAGVGDPVGRIDDKSGNGNNLLQVAANQRPLLQQDGSGNYYLDFDGSDDLIQAAAAVGVDAPVFNILTAVKLDDGAAYRTIAGNARYNFGVSTTYKGRLTTPGVMDYETANDYLDGTSLFVYCAKFDASFDVTLRKNGVAATAIPGSADGGVAEGALTMGRGVSGTEWFDGRVYGLIIVKADMSASNLSSAEAYLAGKCGVTL
jgi:hypothetical protein